MQNRDRLHRSELAVPASNLRMLEKAPTAGADIVFLDLEDAVAPDDKVQARKNAIEALQSQDWSQVGVSVRINGLDTHWAYRDVVDIVEAVGNRLDMILIPKVGKPSDIEFVATLLDQIEQAYGYDTIALTALIETAPGMANVERIAETRLDRMEALSFGVADYAASTRARTVVIGGVTPEYAVLTDKADDGSRELHWGDPWHYALSRMVVACRRAGLRRQVGNPPLADRARQPDLLSNARRDRSRTPHPGRHGSGGERRQGSGLAGRSTDRRRLDQDGGERRGSC